MHVISVYWCACVCGKQGRKGQIHNTLFFSCSTTPTFKIPTVPANTQNNHTYNVHREEARRSERRVKAFLKQSLNFRPVPSGPDRVTDA